MLGQLFASCVLAAGLCALAEAQSPLTAPPLLPATAYGPKLYMADQGNDAIYLLEDLDGNGDCNGPGEIVVYFDSTTANPDLHLATPQFVAVGVDGALYCGDSNKDFILRFEDLDADGVALSPGEATVYYDNLSGGPELVSINNMAFDTEGYLYFTDNGTSSGTDRTIVRIRDETGEGYCTDADGEIHIVYQLSTTTGLSISRPSGMAIEADGTLLVINYDDDHIYRFFDTTGAEDGDGNDADEQVQVFTSDPGGVELAFAQAMAFGLPAGPPAAPLYVSDLTTDTVYLFRDGDLDGLYLNPDETTVFWDPTQADGIIPGTTGRVALGPGGGLFVCEGGSSTAMVPEQVVRLQDTDDDDSANGLGEAKIYCDNNNAEGIIFDKPYALAWEPESAPVDDDFVRGDANDDGSIDIGDSVFILSFLFVSGSVDVECLEAVNTNDDDAVDISDPIFLLSYLFVVGSPEPPAPFGGCGADAGSSLGCEVFASCP